MNDIMWNIFKNTGNIEALLYLKEKEKYDVEIANMNVDKDNILNEINENELKNEDM